jgi:hypothetical protein
MKMVEPKKIELKAAYATLGKCEEEIAVKRALYHQQVSTNRRPFKGQFSNRMDGSIKYLFRQCVG